MTLRTLMLLLVFFCISAAVSAQKKRAGMERQLKGGVKAPIKQRGTVPSGAPSSKNKPIVYSKLPPAPGSKSPGLSTEAGKKKKAEELSVQSAPKATSPANGKVPHASSKLRRFGKLPPPPKNTQEGNSQGKN